LTWENFWAGLAGATRISCMIMFILAGAAFLTKTMAFTGIPRESKADLKSGQNTPEIRIRI
jgi:TRAP-type C4-dicarboxylate transport system permease large subunit